jgi:ATP-binding cassette, subfamily B, bacterial
MPRNSQQPRRGGTLLWEAVKDHKKPTSAGVLAGLVWTACKVTVPTLTARAIDQGILHGKDHPGALRTFGIAIVIVGLVSALCVGARRYLAFMAAWRTETELRHRLFAHLQRLHFAFHDQAQTGQLMSRAATDLQQIQNFMVMIPITIANFVTVIAVTAVLFTINVKLAVLALVGLPFVNFAAKRFSTKLYPVSMELQQQLAGVATIVEETVTGIRAVKGFGAENIQSERMRVRTDRVYDRSVYLAKLRATFSPVLDFLPALGLVAVLWYGGHQVLSGNLTVGQLVAFNTYVLLLIWPLRMLGNTIASWQRAAAAAERIDEILRTDPAIVSHPKAKGLPVPGNGEVRFEDVRFGYIEGAEPVLDGFNLTVRPGEAVALVGPTGSGKTTVARLVPRFYDVDDGRVLLDGVDVRELKLRELRQGVGIVFEDTFLFSETVRGNIAFAQPDAPQDQVERAARLAGAHEFIAELPQGYDTEIGERGFSLSGGQRQRLALARAILANPRVLILDDATSSVDPTKEHEIRGALQEVMRGRSTIVIAHRAATIALADRVVLMDEGKVVAEGTHENLLLTNERYREVLARAEADLVTEEVV